MKKVERIWASNVSDIIGILGDWGIGDWRLGNWEIGDNADIRGFKNLAGGA